jgi:integrase
MELRFKNDYLDIFKKHINSKIPNKNTRKNYIYEINKAFSNQEFNDIKDFDYIKLKNYVENIKGKRSASTLKHALREFSKVFEDFDYSSNRRFLVREIKNKTHKRLTRWDPFKISTAMRKVNSLRDKKLKLGYRTIFATGLRVEEVSNLRKKDIVFKDGKLFVFVERGKNNKQRMAEAIKDNYLENSLKEYIKLLKDDDRLFYKKDYIIEKAVDMKFMTHDLRRAFSKIIFNTVYKRGIKDSKNKAVNEVINRLGHEGETNTYKKYLSRDVDFSHTKWDMKPKHKIKERR